MARIVTAGELPDGHSVLDIECPDRIYRSAYVPTLQSSGQVACHYFCLWGADSGPAFIKACAYFPYPAKIWVNGRERAKRQALKAGIGFTELASGSASRDDPAGLQEIRGRLQAGAIEVFARRWPHRVPVPFGPADRDAGYWRERPMRQVEVSRTIVFDEPRRARSFPGALIAGDLDLGRPENAGVIFGRRVRAGAPGTFRAAIDRPVIDPDDKGGGRERLLQAPAGQAVPGRGPGDADRDRRQLPPRPGPQRPAAQPRRAPGQGPRHQPAHTGSRARRPGNRPREPSLRADRAPVSHQRRAEDPGAALRRSSGHRPGRRARRHPHRSDRDHQQEPPRPDRRAAAQ